MTAPTFLVTLEEVKKHLNKADFLDDEELQGFIDAATPMVENIYGPVINRTITEYQSGGTSTLVLNYLPILSITSIIETYGQTNYTLTRVNLGDINNGFAYTCDLPQGRIVRRAYNAEANFPTGRDNVQIIYVVGCASIPSNVRLGTLMLIAHLWTTSQLNRNGNRPSLGGDDSFTPGMGFAVPNRVKEILQASPRVPGVA